MSSNDAIDRIPNPQALAGRLQGGTQTHALNRLDQLIPATTESAAIPGVRQDVEASAPPEPHRRGRPALLINGGTITKPPQVGRLSEAITERLIDHAAFVQECHPAGRRIDVRNFPRQLTISVRLAGHFPDSWSPTGVAQLIARWDGGTYRFSPAGSGPITARSITCAGATRRLRRRGGGAGHLDRGDRRTDVPFSAQGRATQQDAGIASCSHPWSRAALRSATAPRRHHLRPGPWIGSWPDADVKRIARLHGRPRRGWAF